MLIQAATQAPAPPALPAQPGVPTTVIETPGGARITVPGGVTAQGAYQAARAKREAIRDLLERARNRRSETAGQLRNAEPGVDRPGLEKRIADLDARIYDLEKQQIEVEGDIVALASVPGAVEDPPGPIVNVGRSGPPQAMFVVVPILLVVFVLFPIAFAFARRLWHRTSTTAAAIPQAFIERFGRLENNVDAMALEIERISEGQRFMTKLFAEQGGRAQLAERADPVGLGLTSTSPRP
jgi:hypothetical protein